MSKDESDRNIAESSLFSAHFYAGAETKQKIEELMRNSGAPEHISLLEVTKSLAANELKEK